MFFFALAFAILRIQFKYLQAVKNMHLRQSNMQSKAGTVCVRTSTGCAPAL